MSRRARRLASVSAANDDNRTLALMGAAAAVGDTGSLFRLAATLAGDRDAAIGLASLAGVGLRGLIAQAATDRSVDIDVLIDAVLKAFLGVDVAALGASDG